MTLTVLYRISDNGYPKEKFKFATKERCLKNAIRSLSDAKFYIFIDTTKLSEETKHMILSTAYEMKVDGVFHHAGGSSAASWNIVVDYALQHVTDYVYFLEDDYLHRPNSTSILLEGLTMADYVSLYDHCDKYIPPSQGGNPYVSEDGGETTRVYRTLSTHWKLTNSTTMTFATHIKTLGEDIHIWNKHTRHSTHPNDFACFMDLRTHNNRSLITPIPGYSTHCEPQWASPGIAWDIV